MKKVLYGLFFILLIYYMISSMYRRHIRINACDFFPKPVQNPGIPKIIHQIWINYEKPGVVEPLPELYKTLQQSIFDVYHDHHYMLWTEDDIPQLEKEFPEFRRAMEIIPYRHYLQDIMRYFIMYKYGGIYMDLDIKAIVNAHPFLPDNIVSIPRAYLKDIYVQSALIASPPGHELWLLSWSLLSDSIQNHQSVVHAVGPGFISSIVSIYGKENINILEPCEIWLRDTKTSNVWWSFVGFTAWIAKNIHLYKECGSYQGEKCAMFVHYATLSYGKKETEQIFHIG